MVLEDLPDLVLLPGREAELSGELLEGRKVRTGSLGTLQPRVPAAVEIVPLAADAAHEPGAEGDDERQDEPELISVMHNAHLLDRSADA